VCQNSNSFGVLFVLVRVISWIVPFTPQKKESTKSHELTRKAARYNSEIEFEALTHFHGAESKESFGSEAAKQMRLKSLIFVIFLLAPITARAQEPWTQEKPEQREQVVTNEDGGSSYLVLPASGPLIGIAKPGSGLGDVQQHSIFLGPGWADPTLRGRETRLGSLLATIHDGAQMDDVARAGVTNRFGPTFSIEKLDVPGNRKISDLEIQQILSGLFAGGPLTDPQPDAIYLVFLDPGLQSTLRSMQAGKHYLSYHGLFNASGSPVHYAVVPYQSDSSVAYQIALRTLLVAALHTQENSQ
jgi:hypothetical protein